MLKTARGGQITINSFIIEEDRNQARDYMLRCASSNVREAYKLGLQSLYADPEDVLSKYKDFDIVKEMKARKGAKLLWVRARAIDADVDNANGDYFSKEELLKEVEIKGEKIPSYKTFEGVPIYTNHKNDDIEQAKGMVVYAEWDDKDNCVYCTFFVDEEAYPDIARNIRTGVIHDVSMGASVEWGVCSNCGNKAYTEKDYCDCLKKWKGKKHPSTGKKVFEKNYGIKFIELSCVGDGAFDSCEIQEIYDQDDVLSAAGEIEKKAAEINASIVLASTNITGDKNTRVALESCLRQVKATSSAAVRLSQSVGTLVGGQLMAAPGAGQNATVAAVLQALGIDARSGLNILDLINLSLNFLEVAVMNMFARKDNVDLAHVGKITKSMAELQNTMQDMIDDGIDMGGQQQQQPLNPQAPPQAQQQPVAPASYVQGPVGKLIEPSIYQNEPIGGNAVTASSSPNLVWASRDGKREVFASRNETSNKSNLLDLVNNISELKNAIGDNSSLLAATDNVVRKASQRNLNFRTNTPQSNWAEDKNQMDHFAKIASEQRKKLAAAVTIDFKVEDGAGNRVVLSTDGTISGYVNGQKASWEPILTEEALNLMESGQGTRVAANLLKEFGKHTKTALVNPSVSKDIKEVELESMRKHDEYATLEEELGGSRAKGYARTDSKHEKTREELLSGSYYSDRQAEQTEITQVLLGEAGLYSRNVNDADVKQSLSELVAGVNKGVDVKTLQERLEACRVEGKASASVVMASAIRALGKAVVTAFATPDEVMDSASKLSQEPMLPEMIETSSMGVEDRNKDQARNEFFKKDVESKNPVTAVLEELGAAVEGSEVTAADLANAISVAVENQEITKEGVKRIAELLMGESAPSVDGEMSAPSRTEELKAALDSALTEDDNIATVEELKSAISALAMSSEDTLATPEDVVDEVGSMSDTDLMNGINKAKTASSVNSRLKARARKEFWGTRVASTKDIKSNILGWLADYAINYNIPTRTITAATRKLIENPVVAEKLIAKAIRVKQNAERTAAMTVTQEKSECIRFYCQTEDLGGLNSNDEGFDDAFRSKAMEVLQANGFQVDSNTFAFTDLNITANGDITATVSTRTTKSFDVEKSMDAEAMPLEGDMPVVMTDTARMAKKNLRSNILSKYAQMAPGAAPMGGGMGGGMGSPMGGTGAPDPMAGAGMQGGDLGISALTQDAAVGMDGEDVDAMAEPGAKKPWGSICPVCGSDDVDLAESEGSCNSCGSKYKVTMTIELISDGQGGMGSAEEEPALGEEPPLGGDVGLGAATAPAPMGAPAAPMAPATPGLAPAASAKAMFRLATTVDSDVYLRTAMPDFKKEAELRLPVGMICPACGNREASKVKNSTFCHDCGTMSKTSVRKNKNNPALLDVDITWID
jgi:hypothetical protein